jgi:cephalosporin hydroxylase
MISHEIVDSFHKLFYDSAPDTWASMSWLGVATKKYPCDLWVYQEIIHELRPDLIVETGTRFGGSALFMATICDLIDHGAVVTVDVAELAASTHVRRPHPRITYLNGSSTSPDIVQAVRDRAVSAERVMVVLDSDHSMPHVIEELRLYSDLVTEGSYLIVEDTNVNGHPVDPGFGKGPMEAIDVFLRESRDFVADSSREKFLVTFNPGGFLRRVSGDGTQARVWALAQELAGRQAVADELRSEAAQLKAEIAALKASTSWRITAPLRGLTRRTRRTL